MIFPKKTEKVYFNYERDPRSIFSLPNDNNTISLINSIIEEILKTDFISDFKENFTSNYQKESMIDNVLFEYFKRLEFNLTRQCFRQSFNVLNAIFFVLEYFTAWVNELETNQFDSFFSDLSFYLNNFLISFLSFAHFQKESEEAKLIGLNLEKLLVEIQNFSDYLKENFNINPISALTIQDYKTFSACDIEDLIEVLIDLADAKFEEKEYCFHYEEYHYEKLIYDPLKTFKKFSDLGNILFLKRISEKQQSDDITNSNFHARIEKESKMVYKDHFKSGNFINF